jgi:hypothetical protein
MSGNSNSYKVLSPVPKADDKKVSLAPPLPDLSGKTICAMRHTFRADETFPMLEALFREKYNNIKFISNTEMPDSTSASPAEAAALTKVLKEKGCDVVLAGNGA